MSSRTRIREGMTLEEFLKLPEEKPYLEYFDGRIEAKVSPQSKHSLLTLEVSVRLNGWAKPRRLGLAWPELRCTFAGRSIIPDVVFLLKEHIEIDDEGEPVDRIWCPPDIHVEIISPDQTVKKSREKLAHSTAHGCPLGWLINPEKKKKTIDVFRPDHPPERMAPDGVLDGAPTLPGFCLPVAEVFSWLKLNL
jgi:Uma2 family endonuclease